MVGMNGGYRCDAIDKRIRDSPAGAATVVRIAGGRQGRASGPCPMNVGNGRLGLTDRLTIRYHCLRFNLLFEPVKPSEILAR